MANVGNGSLREKCIAEALKIIARDGVANLSIREVARRLGVSHGAPYKHFANRDALITEIAIEGLSVLRSYLVRGVDYESGDARQNFYQLCRNYIEFAMEQHDYFQLILWSDLPRSGEEYPRLATEAKALFGTLYAMLEHVKSREEITVFDEDLAVLHMFSTIHGYASLMSSGKLAVFDFSLEELENFARQIAESLYTSLFRAEVKN